MKVKSDILDTLAGRESLFKSGATAKIACFNSNGGIPTSRFVEGIFQDAIKIIIHLEDDALAQVIYIDHTIQASDFSQFNA